MSLDESINGEIWEGSWIDVELHFGLDLRKRIAQINLIGNEMMLFAQQKKLAKFPDLSNTNFSITSDSEINPREDNTLAILDPPRGDWVISIYALPNKNPKYGLLRSYSLTFTSANPPKKDIAQPIAIGLTLGLTSVVLVSILPIFCYWRNKKKQEIKKYKDLQKQEINL